MRSEPRLHPTLLQEQQQLLQRQQEEQKQQQEQVKPLNAATATAAAAADARSASAAGGATVRHTCHLLALPPRVAVTALTFLHRSQTFELPAEVGRPVLF